MIRVLVDQFRIIGLLEFKRWFNIIKSRIIEGGKINTGNEIRCKYCGDLINAGDSCLECKNIVMRCRE